MKQTWRAASMQAESPSPDLAFDCLAYRRLTGMDHRIWMSRSFNWPTYLL